MNEALKVKVGELAELVISYEVTLRCEAAQSGASHDAVDLAKRMNLAYLPRVGDCLGVGADNDYLKVESVYWHPAEGFVVFVEFVEFEHSTELMLAQGWVIG